MKALALIGAAAAVLTAAPQASAQVLGSNDLDLVFLLDDRPAGNDDHIDVFKPAQNAFQNNFLTITNSGTLNSEAITDSNTPGIAYTLAEDGVIHRIDYTTGLSSQIADLDPGGDDDTFFHSFTNLPGRDELFVLRTGGGIDDIDSFDPGTGTHLLTQWDTEGGGSIDISDGPAANIGDVNTNGDPTLYTIATGGNFEVFDINTPSTANSSSHVISTGGGPGGGSYVSLTDVPGTTQMAVLHNRTTPSSDPISLFETTSNGRTADVATAAHTGAIGITDAPGASGSAVFSTANGGSVAYVDDITAVTPTVNPNGSAGTLTGSFADVSSAAASPFGFIYIQDDNTANHIDTYDAAFANSSNPNSSLAKHNNLYSGNVTTTAPGAFTDASLTDSYNSQTAHLWSLHTDGKLYQVDPTSGAGDATPFKDILTSEFAGSAGTSSTFDAVTNIAETPFLAILRTDRPTGSKTGGGATDRIDLFNYVSGDYIANAFTSIGTGGISITDGPSFNGQDSDFTDDTALYLIADGGSFEVFDVYDFINGGLSGDSAVISTGISAAGKYVDITNLPGDPNALYALNDRSSGNDEIYRMLINGDDETLLAAVNGTGAISLTDTNNGFIFATATGGASSVTDILGNSTSLNGFSPSHYASVTNLAIPEPTRALFLLAGLATLALRRRR